MHLTRIMDNDWTCFFSNRELFSHIVWHSFSFATLAFTSRTIDRMCWILYSASANLILRKSWSIFDRGAMECLIYTIWSSRTVFWNWCASSKPWYDWSISLLTNFCSSNAVWLLSSLGIVTVFLFYNSLLISCPFIVFKWCTIFSHVLRIWSTDAFRP